MPVRRADQNFVGPVPPIDNYGDATESNREARRKQHRVAGMALGYSPEDMDWFNGIWQEVDFGGGFSGRNKVNADFSIPEDVANWEKYQSMWSNISAQLQRTPEANKRESQRNQNQADNNPSGPDPGTARRVANRDNFVDPADRPDWISDEKEFNRREQNRIARYGTAGPAPEPGDSWRERDRKRRERNRINRARGGGGAGGPVYAPWSGSGPIGATGYSGGAYDGQGGQSATQMPLQANAPQQPYQPPTLVQTPPVAPGFGPGLAPAPRPQQAIPQSMPMPSQQAPQGLPSDEYPPPGREGLPFSQRDPFQSPSGYGTPSPERDFPRPMQNQQQLEYQPAFEELQRAAQAVSVDPRFSPEQKQQAMNRILQRAEELKQGMAMGQQLMSSPYGYDIPPAEQFADIQNTGLQYLANGYIRNPKTGDIFKSTRSPGGQVIPVTSDRVEIDALPPETDYFNPISGKVEVAGAAKKQEGRGAEAASTRGSRLAIDTEDAAIAAYEKWEKATDPLSTPEERSVLEKSISALADRDQRDRLLEMLKRDPMSVMDELMAMGIDVTSDIQDARVSAFVSSTKNKQVLAKKLSSALGIQQEAEPAKPPVDPSKYRIRVGNRGSMVVRRRGSNIDIPAVIGPTGDPIPSPRQANQLADLEVDTEFANIVPMEDGREIRVLPFASDTVNLGDFSLTDAQRSPFVESVSRIKPRNPEEWSRFEEMIQKFQTSGEEWNPRNLNPAQQRLRDLVGNFYRELGPEGAALMTMYIAHSLGYKIDPTKDFSSTGWAKDASLAQMPAPIGKVPVTKQYDQIARLSAKVSLLDGNKRAPEYWENINRAIVNIYKYAEDQIGDTRDTTEGERTSLINTYFDRAFKEIEADSTIPGDKKKVILDDMRKQYARLEVRGKPGKPDKPVTMNAPARPAARPAATPAASPTPPATSQVSNQKTKASQQEEAQREYWARPENRARREEQYRQELASREAKQMADSYDPNKPRWQPMVGPPSPEDQPSKLDLMYEEQARQNKVRREAEQYKTSQEYWSRPENRARREEQYREELASREAKQSASDYAKKEDAAREAQKKKAIDNEAPTRERAAYNQRVEAEKLAKEEEIRKKMRADLDYQKKVNEAKDQLDRAKEMLDKYPSDSTLRSGYTRALNLYREALKKK